MIIARWIKNFVDRWKKATERYQVMKIHQRMGRKADKAMESWRPKGWWEKNGYK